MILALVLLVQASIIPLTMDSTRAIGADSVEYAVAWGYDSGVTAPRIDSLRVYWQRALRGASSRKLAASARAATVRFMRPRGYDTSTRLVCVRYWSRLVSTTRCLAVTPAYLARLMVTPKAVTLDPSPP